MLAKVEGYIKEKIFTENDIAIITHTRIADADRRKEGTDQLWDRLQPQFNAEAFYWAMATPQRSKQGRRLSDSNWKSRLLYLAVYMMT